MDSKEQQQELVTLHMTEPGETLVQEAYEEATLGGSELQQITIPFGGTAEYSIITPISEEIQAPGTLYRSAVGGEQGGGGASDRKRGGRGRSSLTLSSPAARRRALRRPPMRLW